MFSDELINVVHGAHHPRSHFSWFSYGSFQGFDRKKLRLKSRLMITLGETHSQEVEQATDTEEWRVARPWITYK